MELQWIIAGVALVAVLYFMWPKSDIDGAAARKLVENGGRLLDVRTRGEFGSGHLPGALNIPLQELSRRAAEIGAKDRPVVVYCASGARSRSAAKMLKAAGFATVHNLGGLHRW
ncbi:MAG: rhodanese-like domain-containing protein [Sandaracinaceae bacterium]